MIVPRAAKHRLMVASLLTFGTLLFALPASSRLSPSPRWQKGRATDTRQQSEILIEQWVRHCSDIRFSSNLGDYVDHPAYRQLTSLGPAAIPAIMARYRTGNACPWELALEEITGIVMMEDPHSYNRTEVRQVLAGVVGSE